MHEIVRSDFFLRNMCLENYLKRISDGVLFQHRMLKMKSITTFFNNFNRFFPHIYYPTSNPEQISILHFFLDGARILAQSRKKEKQNLRWVRGCTLLPKHIWLYAIGLFNLHSSTIRSLWRSIEKETSRSFDVTVHASL